MCSAAESCSAKQQATRKQASGILRRSVGTCFVVTNLVTTLVVQEATVLCVNKNSIQGGASNLACWGWDTVCLR